MCQSCALESQASSLSQDSLVIQTFECAFD